MPCGSFSCTKPRTEDGRWLMARARALMRQQVCGTVGATSQLSTMYVLDGCRAAAWRVAGHEWPRNTGGRGCSRHGQSWRAAAYKQPAQAQLQAQAQAACVAAIPRSSASRPWRVWDGLLLPALPRWRPPRAEATKARSPSTRPPPGPSWKKVESERSGSLRLATEWGAAHPVQHSHARLAASGLRRRRHRRAVAASRQCGAVPRRGGQCGRARHGRPRNAPAKKAQGGTAASVITSRTEHWLSAQSGARPCLMWRVACGRHMRGGSSPGGGTR